MRHVVVSLVFVALLAVVTLAPAQAALPMFRLGIPIYGLDVGPATWSNLHGDVELVPLQLTLHPFPAGGPGTPGSVKEILPWAKSSLGLDFPFVGDEHTLLAPRGAGLSEAVTVGTWGESPIRVGVGWLNATGWGYFVKLNLASR